MLKKMICLALTAAMCLSGCAYGGEESSGEMLTVYRAESSESGTRLVPTAVEVPEGADKPSYIASALTNQEYVGSVHSAFPAGVWVESVSLEDGNAKIRMSEGYRELEGAELMLAECAAVLSLCGIDEVCSVSIFCGARLMESGLNEECYSWTDGLCGGYERSVKLFAPDTLSRVLRPVNVLCSDDGSTGAPQRIMTALLENMEGMENTDILSCEVDGGVCSLDLSHEFYGAESAESYMGMLMIYSIVNSLCRVPGVDAVSLSVEGFPVESYGGFRTNWPLSPVDNFIVY